MTRVQADLDDTKGVLSPDQLLWRAVVARAFLDAEGIVGDDKGQIGKLRKRITEARTWFLFADEDFKAVCDYAGLDPSAVRRRALEVMKTAGPIDQILARRTAEPAEIAAAA